MTIPLSVNSVVLLDIEGTTTPVDFVYGTLFPFAVKALPDFLEKNQNNPGVISDLSLLAEERRAETDTEAPTLEKGPLSYLLWLIGKDRKSRALKSLQGKIWEEGYHTAALLGEVYEDVRPAMMAWKNLGARIAIYSSGSVLAQKLLFKNSTAGDLSSLIEDYFDTEVGGKKVASSYTTIAERLSTSPENIIFISDVAAELNAAQEAGLLVRYSNRPGNKIELHSFEEIDWNHPVE